MSWFDVGQIATAAIVSAGGIGAILIGVICFSSNKIADALNKKFQASIDKTLEKYKSEVSKKEYVSKTKFDTEFSLYRDLSSSFSNMISSINTLIPAGFTYLPAREEDRIEYERRCYEKALPTVVSAQDVLYSNIPFITEEIYESYEELLRLAIVQLSEYEDKFNVGNLDSRSVKSGFSHEAYRRTTEMNETWKRLNSQIRKYISTLDVVEEK